MQCFARAQNKVYNPRGQLYRQDADLAADTKRVQCLETKSMRTYGAPVHPRQSYTSRLDLGYQPAHAY